MALGIAWGYIVWDWTLTIFLLKLSEQRHKKFSNGAHKKLHNGPMTAQPGLQPATSHATEPARSTELHGGEAI